MAASARALIPALLLLGTGVALAEECAAGAIAGDGDSLLQLPRSVLSAPRPPPGHSRSPCPSASPLPSAAAEFGELVEGGKLALVANRSYAFAHEGPVYLQEQDAVFFVSNRLNLTTFLKDGSRVAAHEAEPDQFIEMSIVNLKSGDVTVLPQRVWLDRIVMGNGAFPDPRDANAVLVTAQGNFKKTSGIYRLDTKTNRVDTLLDRALSDGTEFNSPNDIVADPISGALLFTDPAYGFYQGFRRSASYGNWLWIYPPGANGRQQPETLRVGADHFLRPNGVAFADEKGGALLVTDTGYFTGKIDTSRSAIAAMRGDDPSGSASAAMRDGDDPSDVLRTLPRAVGTVDTAGPRTTYAYDVVRAPDSSIKALSSGRVHSVAVDGAPDGIKVDCEGRVYTGVGNGIEVHRRDGTFLGLIPIKPAGAANFVLVPRGLRTELVAMAETAIYSFMLNTRTCVIAR